MKTVFYYMALVAIAVALGGCETESSDNISISISPNNVTMKKGQSQTFTASGWRDYTWSLEDNDIGILSATKGDSTVYTAIADAPTNSILTLVLSVTATIASTSTDSSPVGNTNGSTVKAEAFIHMLTSPIAVDNDISISPSMASIKKGQSVELKAVGASDVTDYAWKLEDPVHGTLSIWGGLSTIYTATNGPATTIEAPFTQIVSLSSNGGKNTTTAAITISSFP